jgi:hypothetical protein
VHVIHYNAGLDVSSALGRQQSEYVAWLYTKKLATVLRLDAWVSRARGALYEPRFSPCEVDYRYSQIKLPFW